jgi:hypothetical protein
LAFHFRITFQKLNNRLPLDAYIDWDREQKTFICDQYGNYEIHTCNPHGVDRERIRNLVYRHGFWISLQIDERESDAQVGDGVVV